MAGDDDVLHPVVVHEWLEPAEPEQRVEDRPRECVLFGDGQGGHPGVDAVGDGGLDEVEHDRPSQFLLRHLVEPPTVSGDGLTELLRRLGAQSRDQ